MKSTKLKSFFNNHIKGNLVSDQWLFKNSLIFLETQSGLLKGFCFNSSSFSPDQFEIVAFVLPMYVPSDFLGLSFGYFLRDPKKQQWWKYDKMNEESIGLQLANVINKADFDFLSKINDAEEFYNYYKSDKKKNIRFFEAVAYSAAHANLIGADDELSAFLSFLQKQEEKKFEWAKKIILNTEMLVTGNKRILLSEWLLETKKKLKLG